jgi:hypothetical protein
MWTGNFSLLDLPLAELARQFTVWSHQALRAARLRQTSSHYNRLSQWVAYQVLSERNLEKRLDKMKLLIELAQILFNLQNYYDGMAVLSGFDSNSKAQWTTQCLPDGNFKELRTRYEAALRTESPVPPHIGVLLSDLFKYYDATQTFVNGLINVRKCKGVYKMITRIEEFSRGKFTFLPIYQVQEKIGELEDLDEDTLMAKSFEVEKEDGTLLGDA